MPCYSGPSIEEELEQKYRNKISESTELNRKLYDQNRKLQAGLCAIITELEKEKIADRVITQASKSGLIDLVSFWASHSKEDEARLSKELHKFSEHEQEVLKRLLNER